MMNSIEKEIKQEDGTIKTIMITSNDNQKIDLTRTYKLAKKQKKIE